MAFLVAACSFLAVLALSDALPKKGNCSRGTTRCLEDQAHVLLQKHHVVSSIASQAGRCLQEAPQGSAVALHGRLQVKGGKIVDEASQPVQLRGMSLFWSQWMPQYWTVSTIRWLRHDWKINVVRAPMGVDMGGYLENPNGERAKLDSVVEAAVAEGIYVIIDWHDHNAERHIPEATTFFTEVAAKYGSCPNVLFEVFNEPVKQSWHHTIKPYHQQLVQVIRRYSDNLVILGTRTWSTEVGTASNDPVPGDNLAYTIHFYTATSTLAKGRDHVVRALGKGTCEASGNGQLDLEEAKAWLRFLAAHGISDVNWAVSDKAESCSALKPGTVAAGWRPEDLTASGAFIRASLRGESKQTSSSCATVSEDCRISSCCLEQGQTCYEKDAYWASCRSLCEPGVNEQDPPEFRTPWTCRKLGPAAVQASSKEPIVFSS